MKKITVFVLMMVVLMSVSLSASASFSDIDGSWAREAILRLDQLGIFDGIYQDNFQPNNTVTREELIEIAARAFNLTNTQKQTVYAWLDDLMAVDEFNAEQGDQLNRAELVALVANLLGLTEHGLNAANWYPSFNDVPADHPVFVAVEMINMLDILPTYVLNNFEPSRLSSRAEVVALVDAALNLDIVNGEVAEIQSNSNRLIIQTPDNEFRSVPVGEDTLILQNGNNLQFNNLAKGDSISALYNQSGSVQFINVNSTKAGNSLFQGISNLLKGLNGLQASQNLQQVQELPLLQELSEVITPEQLVPLLSGDWSGVNEGLRYNLYQEFVDLGMSPWEAEALLSQDWGSLENMGKDRLALALSDYAGITPEIFYSALNQNWDQLMQYAQVEIAQRLLSGTIF